MNDPGFFSHSSSIVDPGALIGDGSKIWHFSHVMGGARVGKMCVIGQNVFIASSVIIGDNVKIQNNVSLYDGVEIGSNAFLGPSCVFTNVINPRSEVSRKSEYRKTVVGEGATIGANATIVCGNPIGRYAFIGAGSVVTRPVPDHALVKGVPARLGGWMCRCGAALKEAAKDRWSCPVCRQSYARGTQGLDPLI
jgi:UDP-2-acetamido-3-amino-2,3-dideoxy-glucuronate N-acetyltransferase